MFPLSLTRDIIGHAVALLPSTAFRVLEKQLLQTLVVALLMLSHYLKITHITDKSHPLCANCWGVNALLMGLIRREWPDWLDLTGQSMVTQITKFFLTRDKNLKNLKINK